MSVDSFQQLLQKADLSLKLLVQDSQAFLTSLVSLTEYIVIYGTGSTINALLSSGGVYKRIKGGLTPKIKYQSLAIVLFKSLRH